MITSPTMMGALRDGVDNGIFSPALLGIVNPVSGTAGTGLGIAGLGCLYINTVTGVSFVNEGSITSPYWTPTSFFDRNTLAWATDFRDGVGKALADTAATATIPGSGIRVFGQGIDETDSGLVIAIAEDGAIGSLTTTDETAHVAALGVGVTTSVPFQPNSHGPIVVDALVAMSSAITLRRFFIGFLGTAADALDPPVTGSTVTITLVQDDLAGLMFDVGLTATSRLFAPHNKSDEAATIATTATGVDTSTNFPAAGTYVRLRVEIWADGTMVCFADKVQITSIAASLDVDEEIAPVLLVGSTSAATKTMLVKHFAAWGKRN